MSAEARRRTVAGDGVELAVTEYGDPDAPPILLVHGFPDTQALWSLLAPLLAEDFHVVTFDVRGAGESGAPEGSAAYSLEHLAADAGAVIEATCPGRRVHLVGHDWGAIQGWEFLYAEPTRDRVASFTSLCGACPDHAGAAFRDRLRRFGRGGPYSGGQLRRSWYVFLFLVPGLAELIWRRVGSHLWVRGLARDEGIEPDDVYPAPTRAEDGANLIKLYRANLPARLLRPKRREQVRTPVLVIEPDGDQFVAPSTIDNSARFAPGMRRRRVTGGHWIPRTDPEGLAELIGEHAARCERTSALA